MVAIQKAGFIGDQDNSRERISLLVTQTTIKPERVSIPLPFYSNLLLSFAFCLTSSKFLQFALNMDGINSYQIGFHTLAILDFFNEVLVFSYSWMLATQTKISALFLPPPPSLVTSLSVYLSAVGGWLALLRVWSLLMWSVWLLFLCPCYMIIYFLGWGEAKGRLCYMCDMALPNYLDKWVCTFISLVL